MSLKYSTTTADCLKWDEMSVSVSAMTQNNVK